TLKHEQETLISETLDRTGRKLRDAFDGLIAAAARAGNSNVQILGFGGVEDLMQARLDANKALTHPDEDHVKKADASFARLQQSIAGLEPVAKSAELKPLYDDIAASSQTYDAAFKHSIELSRNIAQLVDTEMKQRGGAISEDAGAIVDSAQADQV